MCENLKNLLQAYLWNPNQFLDFHKFLARIERKANLVRQPHFGLAVSEDRLAVLIDLDVAILVFDDRVLDQTTRKRSTNKSKKKKKKNRKAQRDRLTYA